MKSILIGGHVTYGTREKFLFMLKGYEHQPFLHMFEGVYWFQSISNSQIILFLKVAWNVIEHTHIYD